MEQSQNIMLPKYRYDQVNQKYKDTLILLERMEQEMQKKDEELALLRRAWRQWQEDYEERLLDLQVKETFVEGGIVKEQYDMIIPKMTCNKEEKAALAEAIVHLIKTQQEERKER